VKRRVARWGKFGLGTAAAVSRMRKSDRSLLE